MFTPKNEWRNVPYFEGDSLKNYDILCRGLTYDLPITSSDAPPLNYRRFVGFSKHFRVTITKKECISSIFDFKSIIALATNNLSRRKGTEHSSRGFIGHSYRPNRT